MSNALQEMGSSTTSSSSIPWLQALKLTTPIASNRNRILSTVIDEVAAEYGSNAAFVRALATKRSQNAQGSMRDGRSVKG
jgi:hypothetical protein